MRTPPAPHTKPSIYRNTSGLAMQKKTTPQCREPAQGWIHTLRPSWTQEERTRPEERCSAKAQGRERPTVEVNHLEIGSILH